MGTLVSWLADGAQPVSHREAERRALACAVCPLNQRGGLLAYFTRKAAKLIQKEIERKTSMDLWTTVDPILGTCKACTCALELKVHTPIEDVLLMKPKTKAKLDPACWILAEEKALRAK